MTSALTTHLSGYARPTALDGALHSFWQGELSAANLDATARGLRHRAWSEQSGLSYVAVNDCGYADGMLDLACTLGAIPGRFGGPGVPVTLERYFQMARGRNREGGAEVRPLDRADWFDTAGTYSVPELVPGQTFRLAWDKAVAETREAVAAGYRPKPVLIGPVTFLALSKLEGGDALSLLPVLLPGYCELLARLGEAGAEWVEISEPVLSCRADESILGALEVCWAELSELHGPKLMLAVPFGEAGRTLPRLMALPIDGYHVDVTSAAEDLPWLLDRFPKGKVLSLGIVDGRQIWRSDLDGLRDRTEPFRRSRFPEELWIGSSCSLACAPFSMVDEETPGSVRRSWLSGPMEKIAEILAVASGFKPLDACAASRSALESRSSALEQRRSA
jgi:5-methyltetrahydropteroyltriglutamate--homocysteine methyltransferase